MRGDTRMKIEGKIDQLTGRIKTAWADLTDDDINRAEGNWDRLVGIIKEKTGETSEAIQDKLNNFMDKMKSDT